MNEWEKKHMDDSQLAWLKTHSTHSRVKKKTVIPMHTPAAGLRKTGKLGSPLMRLRSAATNPAASTAIRHRTL